MAMTPTTRRLIFCSVAFECRRYGRTIWKKHGGQSASPQGLALGGLASLAAVACTLRAVIL